MQSPAVRVPDCELAKESRISALQNPQMCACEFPMRRKPQFGHREIIWDLQEGIPAVSLSAVHLLCLGVQW